MKKRFSQLIVSVAVLSLLVIGSARAADPVITDPTKTSIGLVTGGDVGEGLDLEGIFPYAISTGAEPDFAAKIRDANFLGQMAGDEVPGATLEAGFRILNWYNINYGDSANDDLLEVATSSIRWSQAGAAVPAITLTLDNIKPGTEYKLQFMFGEQCCNRGFDVFINDSLIIKDFNPGVVHEGIGNGTQEALLTHTLGATTTSLVIRLDGTEASSDYSDHNAILNAVTLEEVGVTLDTDKDGMPDGWELQYGFNPNDASDAAQDFDKDGKSNLEEFKAGTNPTDVTPPTLLSAVSTSSFDTVTMTFSEVVDPTVAAVTSHYVITPALAVTAAVAKKNTVVLTTAKQTPGATAYTVTVNGVVDTSKNPVPTDSKAIFYSFIIVTDGILKFSYWGGITGNPVQNLLDDPRYPATPDQVLAAASLNSRDVFPNDSHEAYGATIEGILTPTETADYDFFLRSDDASQLHISTDATEANLALQAEETGCCAAFQEPGDARTTAAPIRLEASKKYLVRATYKEGTGGDFCQVAWRKTTDATPAAALQPIPGRFFTAEAPAPAEGTYKTISPTPNDKNAFPGLVQIVHIDGKTVLDSSNTSLDVDGIMVQATIEKVGNALTVTYVPKPIFASKSVHTAAFHYKDPGGNAATLAWTFTVFAYSGPTKDTVKQYPGLIRGAAVFTADKGGHTGAAGDYGMDLTTRGGPVVVLDTDFLFEVNKATAADELSAAFWAKHHNTTDTSAFDFNSPTTPNQRAFHAHVPWSNGHIYFDTVGCCDGTTQRIETGISSLPGFTGQSDTDFEWWGAWHHYAFTKKGSTKRIWVDGKLLLEGDNTAKLPQDVNLLYMGADGGGGGLFKAIIDDFATFSKELVEADVLAIFNGTLPSALPAAKGLIGYWPFNDGDVKPVPGPISVAKGTDKVTLSWAGIGFKLLKADAVNGPYTEVAGATSPRDVSTTGTAAAYYKLSN